jgi:hypothetical protein
MPRAQDAQERRVSVLHGTPMVRCDYVQDERYIAKSTWMCGAIVSVSQGTPMVRCDCFSLAQHSYCAVRLLMAGTITVSSHRRHP